MRINKSLLAALAATLALGSCTDFANGFEERQAKYQEGFTETFGKIDPNQDWSMAGYYTAYVFGVEDGTVELYYSDPIAGKTVIIANRPVSGGETSFKFNAVKGTKRFFAKVKDTNGNVTLSGYFEIDGDNVVAIAPVFSRTRANIDEVLNGESRVTKSDAYTLDCPQLLDWDKSDQFHLEGSYKRSAVDYIDGYYCDNTHHQNIAGKSEFYHTGTFTNLYKLYGVIDPADERPWWYVGDVAPFFETIDGNPGCFKESENHVVLMREGSTPQLKEDLIFNMEKTGQFYLDYFYKGTQYDNEFGYFYFTGDVPTREQFMTMPKYVLVDNMSNNMSPKNGRVTTSGPGVTIPWNLLSNQSNVNGSTPGVGIDGLSMAQNNWDTKIIGTRLYLTYFGKDGKGQPSLDFPKDTKIGLFFIGNTEDNRVNKILTSISKLNRDLYNETPHAASFQLNDKVVFAMEDMNYGGDKDINDAMFIAYGDFEKTDIPNIIPPVEPEGQTWIMACEDLGGSYDYDFNDLVFGLKLTDLGDGTANLDLVPLAAGGTLDAKISYDGQIVGEIHSLVDPNSSSLTQINAIGGSYPAAGPKIRLAKGINASTDINEIAKKVKVIVTNDGTTTNNEVGGQNVYNIGYDKEDSHLAPQVLLLPAGWDWPSERTAITTVYPGFKTWVANADVTTWCQTKAENVTSTDYVNNPVRPVTPSTEPEDPGTGGGESGSAPTTGTEDWNITLTGEPVMGMNTTQTITISVEGLDDYSNLVCGTYSENVIKATKVDNTRYTISTATETVRGTARFYVVVPGDATHATTRKVFEITVGAAVPEFYFTNGSTRLDDQAKYTINVNPTDPGVGLGVAVVKGFGTSIKWSSSDESIVKVENNQLRRVACGTVTITATHEETEGGTNGAFVEKSKSIELTIAKIDPGLTVSPTTMQIGENETKAFTVSNNSGANNYEMTSSDETVAQITTLNGGYAIKGLKKGSAIITVKYTGAPFYKISSKQINVTVTESQLDPWVISTTPEIPSSMVAGQSVEVEVVVEGQDNEGATVQFSSNSLVSYSQNNRWVTITAGNTAGEGKFTIIYPGDNTTHKTTSREYTIEIRAPKSVDLTNKISSDNKLDLSSYDFSSMEYAELCVVTNDGNGYGVVRPDWGDAMYPNSGVKTSGYLSKVLSNGTWKTPIINAQLNNIKSITFYYLEKSNSAKKRRK